MDLGSAVDTIDTVGLGCVLSGRGDNTELTAGGGVVEGLASGGGVVDVGGDFDIIGRTQAGLVVGRETPRVGTTVLGNGNGVVTGSCCIDDLTINGGDLGGGGENARRTTLVLHGVLVGEVGDLDSHLVTVNASPCQAVTSVSDGDRVVTTALNAGDGLVGKAFHKLGAENNSIIISGVVGDTSLSIVVETPGPDAALVVNSKRVIVSTCDICDGLLGKTELSGNQALCLGTLDNTATELVLLARAPCKDGAGTVESENVIGATRDLGDLLQPGNKHRLALNKDILSEAEDTFIALSSYVSNCT